MNKENKTIQNNSVGLIKAQQFTFESLKLESGERLGPITLVFETYGALNKEKSNAVLIRACPFRGCARGRPA